jgi:hypothetical protein
MPTPYHPAADLADLAPARRRGNRSSTTGNLYNGVNLNVCRYLLPANSTRAFFQIRLNQDTLDGFPGKKIIAGHQLEHGQLGMLGQVAHLLPEIGIGVQDLLELGQNRAVAFLGLEQ